MNKYYIGLAATMHDPALAILSPSGEPIFAEGTERYLQNKRAYNCPPDDLIRIPRLIREWCQPGAELVTAISWSTTYLKQLDWMHSINEIKGQSPDEQDVETTWPLPNTAAMITGLRNSLSQAGLNLSSAPSISQEVRIRRYDHHLAHAATAAYTSPFEECVIAVVDGYGEMRSTAFYHYQNGYLKSLVGMPSNDRVAMPTLVPSYNMASFSLSPEEASLGFFYGRLCGLCGFDPIKGEEWKVMGLASYGEYDPALYALLRPLIRVNGLRLEPGCSDSEMLRIQKQLRALARPAHVPALEAANLAFTGQQVFEEIMAELLNNLYRYGLSDNLAFVGGCALNSTWNGKILEQTGFKRLHVPSAPADDGNALGSAFLAWCEDHPGKRLPPRFQTPYLGSALSSTAIENMKRFSGLTWTSDPEGIHERAARLLDEGKIIGWVQGRAEFGPRALGSRSILADPRPNDMKDRINARVKFREEFRPFAPSILDEFGPDYFENYQTSPYMERTLHWRPEIAERIPAVVHVDGTGRLQSVRREWCPRYYDLIQAFYRHSGIPLLLNTSFNVMDKPIIHSLEDALGTFFTTGLDALVIEDLLVEKGTNP